MDKELMISILMYDGNTRKDALQWIDNKHYPHQHAIIYENYSDYVSAFPDNSNKLLQDIREHKYSPHVEAVIYNDNEYIIEYIF